MGLLSRYLRLAPDDRRIALRGLLVVGLARLGTGRMGVTAMRRLASRLAPAASASAVRVQELVEAAAALLPGPTPCLSRAIALEALLVGCGHPAELRIGVARPQDAQARGTARIDAHAWVELEGVALDPAAANYGALPIFGTRG